MKDEKLAQNIADSVLDILREKKAMNILTKVISHLERQQKKYIAEVHAPRELRKEELKKIYDLIAKLAGEKPQQVETLIDETIVDGLKIVYKDRVWDMTLSGQLEKLG